MHAYPLHLLPSPLSGNLFWREECLEPRGVQLDGGSSSSSSTYIHFYSERERERVRDAQRTRAPRDSEGVPRDKRWQIIGCQRAKSSRCGRKLRLRCAALWLEGGGARRGDDAEARDAPPSSPHPRGLLIPPPSAASSFFSSTATCEGLKG